MNDVVIKGESKEGVIIYQTNPHADGVVVKDAVDVTVVNLTIDARQYDACAAFVESNAHGVILYNCRIYAGSKIFGVYFAGPPTAQFQPTLDAYQSGAIDNGNMMLDNYIESSYSGDGVSFSLQINGICSGNTVVGTRIAFYLSKNSYVINNTSIDSNSEGIFIITVVQNNVYRRKCLLISLDNSVIPTKVGIQVVGFIDSRLRGNDGRFRVIDDPVLDTSDKLGNNSFLKTVPQGAIAISAFTCPPFPISCSDTRVSYCIACALFIRPLTASH